MMKKNRVLLIGIDAAEWKIIHQLLPTGMLPTLQSWIENGVSGNLKSMNPPFSPMLWTSIATGKYADQHGILGFTEISSEGKIYPTSNISRKSRALWNILNGMDLKSNIVGWWPSFPCDPIQGIMISDAYLKTTKQEVPHPGFVHGMNELEIKELNSIQINEEKISHEDLRIFIPSIDSSEDDHYVQELKKAIAGIISVKNSALYAMSKRDWDFTAVYFNQLDMLSHKFMCFHPPKLNEVPEDLFNKYNNVIVAAYTFLDCILKELQDAAPTDTHFVICSDHGFHSDSKRKIKLPAYTASIALEHNPIGVLIMNGPLFQKNKKIIKSSLLDITPTILSIYNLPIGKDMGGHVMSAAFQNPPTLSCIESWDNMEGNFGDLPVELKKNSLDEYEAMQQLIDLGYIEKMAPEAEEQVRVTYLENLYNLSAVHADKENYAVAISILEKLYEENKADIRYNLDLINYHLAVGQTERAKEILRFFKKINISKSINFNWLEAKYSMSINQPTEALTHLIQAYQSNPEQLEIILELANLYVKLGNWDESHTLLTQHFKDLKDNFLTHHLLSSIHNKKGNYSEAIDHALEAIKKSPDYAPAYYQLGEAFYQMQEYETATKSLEACLEINPNISRARNLLINIYRQDPKDKELFMKHWAVFEQTRKDEIIIVSGLPRSGTSMMMQLLKAGGLSILCDENVKADENNPKGYFEYSPVKNSRMDNSWMENAPGKAVKVIAPLLPALRMKHKLKIIFMEREINEVITSQHQMIFLKTGHQKKELTFDLRIKNTFEKIIQESKSWIAERSNIEVLYVQYHDVVYHPEKEISKIKSFLNYPLNEAAMKNAVLPELHRIKSIPL